MKKIMGYTLDEWNDKRLVQVVQYIREYIQKIYEDGEGYANVKKSTGLVDFLDEEHGKIDMPMFNNEYYDELNGISYIRVLYQFKNNYNTNPLLNMILLEDDTSVLDH